MCVCALKQIIQLILSLPQFFLVNFVFISIVILRASCSDLAQRGIIDGYRNRMIASTAFENELMDNLSVI